MADQSEIDHFLMHHLSDVGQVFPEHPERALAIAATLAARGVEIPEYLLEMYLSTVPCPRPLLEAAIAMAVQLGYLRIECTCSSTEQKLFCLNNKLIEYPTIDPDCPTADRFRCDVAEYRLLMYT